MKSCSSCKTEKDLSEFNRKTEAKDGLQSQCRECSHKTFSKYYNSNKEKHKKTCAEASRRAAQENKRKAYEYLLTQHCLDCGDDDPVVLDFDHVRGKKVGNVCTMIHDGHSWTSIKAEIDKCEIRCASCHRKKTARERGLYRYIMSLKNSNQTLQ